MRELLGMPMVPLLRGGGTELAWNWKRDEVWDCAYLLRDLGPALQNYIITNRN